jgi:hypothetical protein
MANIKELIQSIEAADSSFDEKLNAINQMEETLVAMRQQEQEAIDDNVDLIVEAINVMQKKVDAQLVEIQAIIPEKGDKGDKGKDGKDGKNGLDGKDGKDGLNGKDGIDGKDGVSVTDAKIDFDGSLIISLSTGQEINVGEVVAPELQEKIKLVTSGGAGTVLPSQTGNANKYLKTDGSALSWAAGDGTGTVTSVGGTGTVNGLSLSGTVTTSGNLTLGGTLDLSSPPAIGATSPSTGTFTTLTAQTEVLKGTGQNLVTYSNTFSSWTNTAQTLTGSQSDPFGGSTATLIVPTAVNTTHQLYQVPSAYTGQYTLSIYVKASGYSLFWISDTGAGVFACGYDLSAVTATPNTGCTGTITAVTGATGWYRLTCTITGTTTSGSRFTVTPYPTGTTLNRFNLTFAGDGTSGAVIYGAQWEIGNTVNTYVPTTTTAVYGTPSLSFSGVAGLGLQSDGSLYVSPAGTGAIQAQATTSTTAGGNARGANAVDWQTSRSAASQVASSTNSVVSGGTNNTASGQYSVTTGGYQNNSSSFGSSINGGYFNTNSGYLASVGGGQQNNASKDMSSIAGGQLNTAAGFFNVIGGGFTNSGTSGSSVTTQSGTMNGTTAVTLSGSNASIKVGQLITGTSIASYTYVAAISGTSLTLSQAASGSSTSTLSFYTPHGVVVGGGNNQATGSYSFIGGGGDAGTAGNRNVASGDWSTVAGGRNNTASGGGSFVGGGGVYPSINNTYPNTASAVGSSVVGGLTNTATNEGAFVGGGLGNTANGRYSSILGGTYGTTRNITGNQVFSATQYPISGSSGITQSSLLVLARQTTDATATVLCSDANAASGTNQVILPNNSAYYFRGEVVAGKTGAGDTKGWSIEGVIKRGANAASTAIVGTATVTSNYADAGASTWALTATADTTNGGLAITFTGQASTTIRCVAQIRTTEMTY